MWPSRWDHEAEDWMLIVTGAVRCAPENLDRMLETSLAHVARSRTEPGCIEHGVYRDGENGGRLFFFERWESREALEAHFRAGGSKDFMRAVRELASERDGPNIWEVEE